jgi:hypothetical protein
VEAAETANNIATWKAVGFAGLRPTEFRLAATLRFESLQIPDHVDNVIVYFSDLRHCHHHLISMFEEGIGFEAAHVGGKLPKKPPRRRTPFLRERLFSIACLRPAEFPLAVLEVFKQIPDHVDDVLGHYSDLGPFLVHLIWMFEQGIVSMFTRGRPHWWDAVKAAMTARDIST